MTSNEVLNSTKFSDSGIAVGFGYIRVELTTYLTKVANMDLTVIDRNKSPFKSADPEFGERLLDLYENEFNIDIITGADAK